MRFRIELSEEAKFDLASTASWYEIRSEGRGEGFITAVEQMLDRIGENPEAYPFARGNLKRAFSWEDAKPKVRTPLREQRKKSA